MPANASGASHHHAVYGKAQCRPNAHRTATAVAGTVAEVMVRRLATAVVLAAMMALSVSGCGRQVTGLNAPNGGVVPPGQMLIRFETAGPLDFSHYTYLIVFNTQGTNREPYALGNNSNYTDWSFALQVGGSNPGLAGGISYAGTPILYQIYQNPQTSSGYQTYIPPYPPNQVLFQATVPTSVASNGFQVQFNRCILDQPNPAQNPRPPANTATDCTGPTYQYIKNFWNINLFTIDSTGTVVDSLGTNGANDTSLNFGVDTNTTVNDQTRFKPANVTVNSPSAQVTGIEVFTTP